MTPTGQLLPTEQLDEILATMDPDGPLYLAIDMADADLRFVRDLANQCRRYGPLDLTRPQREWLRDIHHKVYRQAHPRRQN